LDSANLEDFELTEFIWTVPSGWTITSSSQFETINVTTDLGTGGEVTARARNRACTTSNNSDIGVKAAGRKMPSPCPVVSATRPYELCGESINNTFNCAGLPNNFVLPPGGVTYTWSVIPADGWVKIGELDNTVKYQTDGQKDRTVRVTVSAYGVSSSCELFVPLVLVNYQTRIVGPETLCDGGNFNLTLPLAPGATSSWAVTSLTPGLPNPPVSPTSGTGTAVSLSTGDGGGLCRLLYTITGCGKTVLLADTFFAGTPVIYDQRIDDIPGTLAYVCPGTHWASLKVQGADAACVSWENSGNNPFYFACLTGDVYMSGFNGSTAFTARASNVCGTDDTRFFFLPKNWGCDNHWRFSIFPNPAVDIVTIQTQLTEGSTLNEAPSMNGLRLISSSGNIAYQTNQTSDSFTINLAGIAPGTYTMQTTVEGVSLSEIIQVKIE
jgi:PKD-like domain/Secretion system C-terminal sorting domain